MNHRSGSRKRDVTEFLHYDSGDAAVGLDRLRGGGPRYSAAKAASADERDLPKIGRIVTT